MEELMLEKVLLSLELLSLEIILKLEEMLLNLVTIHKNPQILI
jgi:hypothetical protein